MPSASLIVISSRLSTNDDAEEALAEAEADEIVVVEGIDVEERMDAELFCRLEDETVASLEIVESDVPVDVEESLEVLALLELEYMRTADVDEVAVFSELSELAFSVFTEVELEVVVVVEEVGLPEETVFAGKLLDFKDEEELFTVVVEE